MALVDFIFHICNFYTVKLYKNEAKRKKGWKINTYMVEKWKNREKKLITGI